MKKVNFLNKPIAKVIFLDPHFCIVACDSFGILYFIGILKSKFKQKVVLTKTYTTLSLTNKEEAFPVMAIKFFSEQKLLFLGDEMGNIKVWSLSTLLKKVD
jgi:ferredoxin-fold anticodon binding domain-containing protein